MPAQHLPPISLEQCALLWRLGCLNRFGSNNLEPPFTRYPREHAAAIGGGQCIEQKVSGKQSRASANAAVSTRTASMALRSERTAMRIAQ